MSQSPKSPKRARTAQATSADAPPPPREITPEMRRRTARTFMFILGAFVTGIGMMVAALAWMGRVNREYGQEVYRAVMATNPSPNVSYQQVCTDALPRPLPRGVEACEVGVDQGKVTVTVKVEGGRQYQVNR